MKKKTLIFVLLVFALIFVLLYLVAWSWPHPKKDLKKMELKQAKVVTKKIELPLRVRVIALAQHEKTEKTIIKKPKIKKKFKARRAKKKIARHVKNHTRIMRLPFKKLAINSTLVKKGGVLLQKNRRIPVIQTSYDHIGFYDYLKHMKAIGGRLFVGNALKRRIVGEAVLYDTGCQYKFIGFKERMDSLDAMALFRPREIVGEPLALEIVSKAKAQFGTGDFRCVVILPFEKEAAMLGALEDYLHTYGYPISRFGAILGRYSIFGHELVLRLEEGVLRDSKESLPLNMELIM